MRRFEIENFTWIIPYCVLTIGVILIYLKHSSNKAKYNEFIKNSPGNTMDTSGILFGNGHPKYQKDNIKLNNNGSKIKTKKGKTDK